VTRPGRRALIALGVLTLAWWSSGVVVLIFLTARPAAWHAEPLPANAAEGFEELRLSTRDGEELGAWFVDSDEAKPAILLLHGYSGSRTRSLARVREYAGRGHPILALTFRAHGDSTGERVDYGLSSRHDVIAAVEFLEERLPDRPIVIHGFSLGSAAAAFASAELDHRVCAYILDGPYETISIAVRNRTRRVLPTPLDDIAWLALLAASPLRLDVDELRPIDAVRSVPVDTPVLILSGESDTHALTAEARAIADAIGPAAQVVTIPGATHDHLPEAAPHLYWSTVWAFVDRIAGMEYGVGDETPDSVPSGAR
jgi:alpha-beta hydrolase superfamily lysophospholipase